MILASEIYGEDAAYLYVQTGRYYLRTGKYLYKMVLSGSNQEKEQALVRGMDAVVGRTTDEIVDDYVGILRDIVQPVLLALGA